MSNVKKLMMSAAGGDVVNVENVFSTFIYDGTSSAQTITNGIDLSTEGGLVWTKNRDTAGYYHNLIDTERGISNWFRSDATNGNISTLNNAITSFNSDGYSLGTDTYAYVNNNNKNYVSWTFRKAPKFFDVVTYTGDGTTSKTVSHNLGTTPGAVFFKRTDASDNWTVWHRSISGGGYSYPYQRLNGNFGISSLGDYGNNLTPTSSVLRTPVHTNSGNTNDSVNVSGASYIAYVFAHNDGDGDFGPTGDQDIIKCGGFTTDGSGDFDVDLGFEPQFLLFKRTDNSQNWHILDSMRTINDHNIVRLYPNATDAESQFNGDYVNLTSTGFKSGSSNYFGTNAPVFYIAIRRGPMAVPENATDVFAVDQGDSSSTNPQFVSNFVTDLAIWRATTPSANWETSARLINRNYLRTNSTSGDLGPDGDIDWDYMTGHYNSVRNTSFYSWMWKRAPNFCDVVTYTGDGTAGRTVNHNLGVAPEMMWVRNRTTSGTYWAVYHADLGNQEVLFLNDNQGDYTNTSMWGSTTPTDTQFTVGTYANIANQSGKSHIAFLFASLDGISKVGSYSGSSSDVNVDCGFSSGARFVLIKRTDSSGGGWYVYDSVRGIVSGNDPRMLIDETSGQNTGVDEIDPYSSGFTVVGGSGNAEVNTAGGTYIFYAVA